MNDRIKEGSTVHKLAYCIYYIYTEILKICSASKLCDINYLMSKSTGDSGNGTRNHKNSHYGKRNDGIKKRFRNLVFHLKT